MSVDRAQLQGMVQNGPETRPKDIEALIREFLKSLLQEQNKNAGST